MKRLMIIRHAKSDWADAGARDYDRPLNARGEHDALVMGRYLAEQGWKPQRVLCSPARRTRQTAALVLAQFAGDRPVVQWEEALYLASAAALLQAIRATASDIGTLAVIAHNPGVSHLFYHLCGDQAEPMPTCAVAVIDCAVSEWADVHHGRCERFVSPQRIGQGGSPISNSCRR